MTETTSKLNIEELRKKYLKNKKVYIKPNLNKELTLTKAGSISAHTFMYENAIYERWLPVDDRNNLINPFENDEELEFFEAVTNKNLKLNLEDPTCAWRTSKKGIRLRFTVDSIVKGIGYELDLSKPFDMLIYKLAKLQRDIAPSFKERNEKSHYNWYLADGEEEKKEKREKGNLKTKLHIEYGSIKDSKDKMKELLELYYATNQINKEVNNVSEDSLQEEILSIIEEEPKKIEKVMFDSDKEVKQFILKALKVGALQKTGLNSYSVPGGQSMGYKEFISHISLLKKNKNNDDTYGIIEARIETAED